MSTITEPAVRISVARYHEMIEQGYFAENENFELLNGVLVPKMTRHPPHVITTRRCLKQLSRMLPVAWHLRSQEPLTLQRSEPEPDVAVIQGDDEDYAQRHPTLNEIGLVIEVAYSTLAEDRAKASIYAEAEIPVYWIINLIDRVVEVYTAPKLSGESWSYTEQQLFKENDAIPVNLAGEIIGEVQVSELIK